MIAMKTSWSGIALFVSLCCSAVRGFARTAPTMKIAVTGATGRLGRQVVVQLSKKDIPVRCLLRRKLDKTVEPSVAKGATSAQVAAYLSSLKNVEMVSGDVTDPDSVNTLLEGCDAVIACHGAPPPSNMFKSLFPFLNPETDKAHPYMVNFVGVRNIIDTAMSSRSVKRIVRITGKGEQPWSFFSILINLLGNMAKAWNYEGEELLRQCHDVDYTIIRPGVMGRDDCPKGAVLALADNGGDLKVSAVPYDQIANLCIECLEYPNTLRSTLCAMNVPPGEGEETYAPLLAKVKPDSREFPKTLLKENRKAVRAGAAILVAFLSTMVSSFVYFVKAVLSIWVHL